MPELLAQLDVDAGGRGGRIVGREDTIQQPGLPARLGAVRRRAGRRDPRSPRPRGRMAPGAGRSCGLPRPRRRARWASAPRSAWKSVTVVLESLREVDGCVVASGRLSALDHRGDQVVDSDVTCVAEFRDGRMVRRPRSCRTTTRWPGSARVPHCPSERDRLVARRDLAREARLGELRPAARRAPGRGSMPSSAASSSPRTSGGAGPSACHASASASTIAGELEVRGDRLVGLAPARRQAVGDDSSVTSTSTGSVVDQVAVDRAAVERRSWTRKPRRR